jgi:ribosomal protein S13
MATKKTQVVVEIKTDSTQATAEANKTKDEVAGIGKAAAGSIAELKELKKQLKNTAAGSEEFKTLFNQIDDLEDKIKGSKKASSDWIDTLESAGGPLGMLGGALNRAKVATTSFGAALKATGIGLIVTLIGGLAAAFAKNEAAMKKLEPIMTQVGRLLNGILGAMEPLINAFISFAEKALPYVTDGFRVAYSALSSFLQGIGMVGSAVKKFISGDFAGAWDDAKKSVTEFGTRYEQANKRFIAGSKELTDTEKEEQAKRLAQQKEAAERREAELLKAQEKEQALLLKSYEDYLKRREFARKNLEGISKAEMKANDALDLADAEKKGEDQVNNNLKWQNKSLLGKVSAIQQGLAADKQASDQSIALSNNERDSKIATLQAIANATEALSGIIGQQTKVGKALGISSALINTYIGASEVIRAKSVLPEPFGTIQKIASVAGIIATGIKSVKAIMGVQVPSVKGGGGGGVSMPSIPSMNVSAPLMAQATTTTLNQGQINQIGNVAARAYVVESDISGNQERVIRLNRAARIN